jgi:hypothetical protein
VCPAHMLVQILSDVAQPQTNSLIYILLRVLLDTCLRVGRQRLKRRRRRTKAEQHKIMLEMIGDRPEADAKAPENESLCARRDCRQGGSGNDLQQVGVVTACDIVRDRKTGDSLSYVLVAAPGSLQGSLPEDRQYAHVDDRCASPTCHFIRC